MNNKQIGGSPEKQLDFDPKELGLGKRFDNFALNTHFNGNEIEFDIDKVKKAMPDNWYAAERTKLICETVLKEEEPPKIKIIHKQYDNTDFI